MASKNANASIKRTGELLLSGWKLLNSACPMCNTALLSKGENLRCPMCDLAVVKESDQAKISQMEMPSPPVVAERKFEIEDDYYAVSGADAPFVSLEGAKKEYDEQNKRMTGVSNKLGEKMIAGFSMLSTVCPEEACRGTPLVRLGSAPMVCVSCDREYLISAIGDLVTTKATTTPAATVSAALRRTVDAVPAPTAAATAATTAAPIASAAVLMSSDLPRSTDPVSCGSEMPHEDAAFFLDMHNAPMQDLSRFAHDDNDASTQISKRLMQGWALLDHCCQSAKCRGEVPLMRDLNGKEVCVQCSAAAASAPAQTFALPSVNVTTTTSKKHYTAPASRGKSYAAAARAAADASTSSEEEAEEKEVSERSEDTDYSDSEAEAELWQQHLASRTTASTMPSGTTAPSTQAPLSQASTAPAVAGRAAERFPPMPRTDPAVSRHIRTCLAGAPNPASALTSGARVQNALVDDEADVAASLRELHQKLRQTVRELSASTNVAKSTQLADLVAKLGLAIQAVQAIQC